MAFEIIFGSDAIPGSRQVWERMLELQNRADVETFCTNVRNRIALTGRRKMRNEAAEFERRATEARRRNEAAEAGDLYMKALDIYGEFISQQHANGLIESLSKRGQHEEAVAMASLAFIQFNEMTHEMKSLHMRALASLGYAEAAEKTVQKDWKSLSEEDLKKAVDRLLNMDSSNWHKNTFILAHLNLHLEYQKQQTIDIMTKDFDKLPLLMNEKSFFTQFAAKSPDDMSIPERRFYHRFLIWINQFFVTMDPANSGIRACQLIGAHWYMTMVETFFDWFVQRSTLAKFASQEYALHTGAWVQLYSYHSLIYPIRIIADLQLGTLFIANIKQLVSVTWMANALANMFFIGARSGSTIAKRPISLMHDPGRFFDDIFVMCQAAQIHSFKLGTAKFSNQYAESFDLLLLIANVAFAEWKEEAFMRRVPISSEKKTLCMMERASGALTSPALNKEGGFPDLFRDSCFINRYVGLLSHDSLLMYFARRLSFLSANLHNLTFDGSLHFTSLTLSFEAISPKSLTQFYDMANCDSFVDLVAHPAAKVIAEVLKTNNSECEIAVGRVAQILAHLLLVSKHSSFAQAMRHKDFDKLLAILIMKWLEGPKFFVSTRLIGAILRNGDGNCMRRWRLIIDSGLLLRFAEMLWLRIKINVQFALRNSDFNLPEAVNILIALETIFNLLSVQKFSAKLEVSDICNSFVTFATLLATTQPFIVGSQQFKRDSYAANENTSLIGAVFCAKLFIRFAAKDMTCVHQAVRKDMLDVLSIAIDKLELLSQRSGERMTPVIMNSEDMITNLLSAQALNKSTSNTSHSWAPHKLFGNWFGK